jgi:hypothetical protein
MYVKIAFSARDIKDHILGVNESAIISQESPNVTKRRRETNQRQESNEGPHLYNNKACQQGLLINYIN